VIGRNHSILGELGSENENEKNSSDFLERGWRAAPAMC